MSYQIEEIEDIGTAFAEKLKFINMRTSADLLAADASKKVRESLLKATGKSKSKILTQGNHYDLFWLKGIGWQFSELFEAAVVVPLRNLPYMIMRTFMKNWKKKIKKIKFMEKYSLL